MPKKYRNTSVKAKNGIFDSKKELMRWKMLQHLEQEGEIKMLRRQVKFELIPHQKIDNRVVERACYYVADFTYMIDDRIFVEDVKSEITRKNPEYIIKRKLMLFRYGIRVKEV